MNVTITVDGNTYDFDTITQASNRDCMALEDALGVTYETFMKRFGKRFKEIAAEIKAAAENLPEGVEPDLTELDLSISARDTTALVFLARRKTERNLKFDDVDFQVTSFRFGVDGEPDEPAVEMTAADAHADPTDGLSTTTLEPLVSSSDATV